MHDLSCDAVRPAGDDWSPATVESRGDTLFHRAERRFADRAGYADAAEQFLLGADLAKPSVVGGGKRLAGDEAGAGVGNAQFRRLLGFIISRRAPGDAGHRHDALLDHVVAVLQRERILLAQRQRLAQGGAELALLLGWIEARFDRRLVPDRADAGGGERGPCRP